MDIIHNSKLLHKESKKLIEAEKNTLFNEKSLKKRVIYFLISFIILFALVVAVLSSVTLYNMKIESISSNQTLVLKQIKASISKYLKDIKLIEYKLDVNNLESKFDEIYASNRYDAVLILDKDAKLKKAYTPNEIKTNDFKEKVYFTNLKNQNYFSEIFYSQIINKNTVTYSFRFKDNIIVLFLNLEELKAHTKNILNDDMSPMISLFDKEGSLIVDQEIQNRSKEEVKQSEIYSKLINKNDEYQLTTFSNICLGTIDNGMYTKIENTNWFLVIRQNNSLVESYLFKILLVILFTIAFFTVLAILLSRRLLSTIFLSLEKFEIQTANIAQGNYKERVIPDKFTEFEKLSHSFEKMRYEINKRENHLKQSLKNFKVLIDSTMEAVVIHDTKVIIDINYSALKIIGAVDKKELIGKPIKDFISDNYKRFVDDFLIKNKISIKPHEYEIINNMGATRNVIGQEGIIEYEGKERRISVFLDITDIKNKDKLIFQQSKMASIGEMLSNIAHHWRQPLNTIRTLASASKLEEELGVLDKDELIKRFEIINDSTVYLSNVIDDLSDYSSNRKKLQKFNISNIIDNSVHFLKSNLTINNVKIIKNLDESLNLYGDVHEFTQVIINILNNSQDAFLSNNISQRYIFISLSKIDEKIVLSIQDSAKGIAKEQITKIFDPYFTTKHKSQGTGVGLFLIHQIVTEHFHGSILAKNSFLTIEDKKHKGLEIVIEFETSSK